MYEVWKPIVNYEGLYEVSSLGRVKRLSRRFTTDSGHVAGFAEMIMTEGPDRHDVILYKDGKYRSLLVRSIVAEAFLGVPYGEAISHIDRDISNSKVSNLIRTSEFRNMDPNWRDIPGWEGEYQASRFGEIRSVDRYAKMKNGSLRYCPGVVRTLDTSPDGYYQLALYRNGKSQRTSNAHIFVAMAWIPNPENKPTVNHIDGNKHNNNIDNLEWATYKEQQEHAVRTGLRKKSYWNLEQFGPVGGDYNEKRQIAVRCIETGQEFPSFSEAARAFGSYASEVKVAVETRGVCKGHHFVRATEPDFEIGIPSLEGEIWKEIPGYEGLYAISNKKRVKSLSRQVNSTSGMRTVPEKILNTTHGVSLNKDNKAKVVKLDTLYNSVFGSSKKLWDI